jgi:hypothetical protein
MREEAPSTYSGGIDRLLLIKLGFITEYLEDLLSVPGH